MHIVTTVLVKVEMIFDGRKFDYSCVYKIDKSWNPVSLFLVSDTNNIFHVWRNVIKKHPHHFSADYSDKDSYAVYF